MQRAEKYYEADAFRREATGRILAVEPGKTGGKLALDGTVFYPEGGGQPADRGTLTLADGATLVVYGGEGNVVNTKGGTAVQLENGTITGSGKLVAIGGQVLWEEGGTAVSGTGTISTGEVYLQGATASQAWNAQPGKAVSGDVTITSAKRHIADGSQKVLLVV